MSGERIVSQATGVPVAQLERLDIGGAYFSGDVTGDVPTLPNISATIKTADDTNPLFLQDTPVIASTSKENHYGTIKSVDFSLGHNSAGIAIEPITSKLSQETVTYPSWGPFNTTVPGQISALLNSCGITYWPIPGQLHHAFEEGGSNRRGVISPEVYINSRDSTYDSWEINGLVSDSPSPLLFNNLTQMLVTTQSDSLALGSRATFTFVQASETNSDDSSETSYNSDSVVSIVVDYTERVIIGSSIKHTFSVSDYSVGDSSLTNVTFMSDSRGSFSNSLRINVSLSQQGTRRTLKVVGGCYSVTNDSGQSTQTNTKSYTVGDKATSSGPYKLYRCTKYRAMNAYVYNLTDGSFDVGNAPRLYPYEFSFGVTPPTERLGVPGATGTGWSILSDMLTAYGFSYEISAGKFSHKSNPIQMEKTPRELGYLSSPLTLTSNARTTAARCNISLYNYVLPTGTTPIRLWTSDTTYSIGVGETQEVVVDFEDGTSLTSLVQPQRIDASVLAEYINKGTGGSVSGYSVWTTDNREVMGTAWKNSGASVTARIGDNSNQVILKITGPMSRIYPGNDETDNGNYSIAPYAGADKNGMILAGLGIKSTKKIISTLTGAPAQTSRESPVEYDNKFVSSIPVLWDVASDLAYAYGSGDVRASGSLTNPFDPDPYSASAPSKYMRIGALPVTVDSYTRQAGGVVFSDARIGTVVGVIDYFYVDQTCQDVLNEKPNYLLSQDTIQPYGKGLV